MPPLALYFIHGWGYDRSFWNIIHKSLSDLPCYFYEAGYFGETPDISPPTTPYLAIGHSAGVMTCLSQNRSFCRGLIAFNGFPRFTRSPSFPEGIHERILQRMILRLTQAPQETLTQFRSLCGESGSRFSPLYEISRLQAGLNFLRDGDASPALAQWKKALVNITGSLDPLFPALKGLPQPPAASLWKNYCYEGGHLLPITHKEESITIIREIYKILVAET